nr:hypothetical protein [Actinomadura barringtoniae]
MRFNPFTRAGQLNLNAPEPFRIPLSGPKQPAAQPTPPHALINHQADNPPTPAGPLKEGNRMQRNHPGNTLINRHQNTTQRTIAPLTNPFSNLSLLSRITKLPQQQSHPSRIPRLSPTYLHDRNHDTHLERRPP